MSEARESNLLINLWRTPMRDLIRLRLSRRLDWWSVIANGSIPDASKAVLTKLVRKTRLWRLEKAHVSRELVAHFEDALAAGQDEAEVLDLFGDWRKTAKLIRRATKRKRGYLWHAWRYTFWAVALLIGVYTAMGLYYLTGSRNIAVDYAEVLNRQAAAVPEDERAWPVIRQAMLAMGFHAQADRIEGDQPNAYHEIGRTTRPGETHWPMVEAFLIEHESSIAELRRAANFPGLGYVAGYYTAEADRPLFEPNVSIEQWQREVDQFEQEYADEPPMMWVISLPQITTLRSTARVLDADLFRAAEAGDADTAHANLVAMLGVADQADEHNFLISQLVSLAIRQMAFASLSEVSAAYPDLFSSEQLTDLAHRIAAVRTYKADLAGERLFFDDLLQHLYTDDGNGNGHLDARAWRCLFTERSSCGSGQGYFGAGDGDGVLQNAIGTAITPAIATVAADRQTMKAMADRMFKLLEADYAEPMWQRPESRADAELAALAGGSRYQQMRYALIYTLMPSFGAVRETSERYNARADGVLTGIALELYRKQHGGYTESLDALVPRYTPEVPIDRITGGPLSYALKDGRPVLYSFGADRDDDGGTIAYDKKGNRTRDVVEWTLSEGQTPVDGDWVVWPQHDEREED